jgi:hypothetical protein
MRLAASCHGLRWSDKILLISVSNPVFCIGGKNQGGEWVWRMASGQEILAGLTICIHIHV